MQVQMHDIELAGLDAHVPGSLMLHLPLSCLLPHRLLKDLQSLVALRDDPSVRFERSCRTWSDEQSWPDSPFFSEVWCSSEGMGIDAIEPVDSCLEVKIVPESVLKE